MVLVKEDTMKSRNRTLGAIGATVVTGGLVLGLALGGISAASNATPNTPTPASTMASQMPDMGSMMANDMNAMAAMMGSADLTAMHAMMHQMMAGVVDDETLAACDTAHEAMAESMTSMTEQDRAQHGAHHGTTES